LRHKISLNRKKASEGEIDTLEEVLDQIGEFGVFGSAFRAVVDKLKKRDDAPDTSDGSLLRTVGELVPDLNADLLAFFHERLKVYLRDQGLKHDVIDACLMLDGGDDLWLISARAKALGAILKTEDGENLVQGFKRANNILTQAEEKDGVEYSFGPDVKYAEVPEEKELFAALETAEVAISKANDAEDFTAAMEAMAKLRAPIDAFFEAVQVNTDKDVVRRNRLNLLGKIRDICMQAADLTKLEG